MTKACALMTPKYANPFGTGHKATIALLRLARRPTSYAPATRKNRLWAARELYVYWMYGRLPHLPREVFTCLPLHLPERPTFGEIKAELAGKSCDCPPDLFCPGTILAYIAAAKGYAVHPPLRGTVPERRRASSRAEIDELATRSYQRSNRWGI